MDDKQEHIEVTMRLVEVMLQTAEDPTRTSALRMYALDVAEVALKVHAEKVSMGEYGPLPSGFEASNRAYMAELGQQIATPEQSESAP
jgi:hypothetical protein